MTVGAAPRRATFLALTVLPLLLTGCMRYALDGEIHRDDTISGSFVFALRSQFVEQFFASEAGFLSELNKQLTTNSPNSKLLVPMKPSRGHVSLSLYRSGNLVGYRQHFDAVPLSELNRSIIHIRHVDDRFIVDMAADVIGLSDLQPERKPVGDPGSNAPASPQPSGPGVRSRPLTKAEDAHVKDIVADQLRSRGVDPEQVIGDQRPNLRIGLTFPGHIIAANGVVDGRSVSWQLALDDTRKLHVSAWDSPHRSSWLLQLFLAICAVGGLGVLYQLVRYRWRRRYGVNRLPPEQEPPSLGFLGLPTLGGDGERGESQPGVT